MHRLNFFQESNNQKLEEQTFIDNIIEAEEQLLQVISQPELIEAGAPEAGVITFQNSPARMSPQGYTRAMSMLRNA